MIYNNTNKNEIFMLSIDPGKSKIGLSLISYKNITSTVVGGRSSDPRNPLDYKTYWFAVWDTTKKGQVKRLIDNTLTLQLLLEKTPEIQEIASGPPITVCFEHQEGVLNSQILFHLMRVNHLSGILVGYFMARGHRIIYAAKKAKWGWNSYNRMARELHPPPPTASRYNGKYASQKRSMVLKQRTTRKRLSTRYVIIICVYQDNAPHIKNLAINAKLEDFNHIADEILQGMDNIRSSLCHSSTYTNDFHENIEKMISDKDFKRKMKNHKTKASIRQYLINLS